MINQYFNNNLAEIISTIIEENLGLKLSIDDKFSENNIDEITKIEILLAIEEVLNKKINEQKFLQIDSIADILKFIEKIDMLIDFNNN